MAEEFTRTEMMHFRMQALEMLTTVLAEAIEDLKPGFSAKAFADIREWAARPETAAMLPKPERDAVLDTFEAAFRRIRRTPAP